MGLNTQQAKVPWSETPTTETALLSEIILHSQITHNSIITEIMRGVHLILKDTN